MRKAVSFLGVLSALLVAVSGQAASVPSPGMQMLGIENYKGAEAYFQSELQKNPQDAQAAAGLAKVNLAQGQNEAGVDWAKKATGFQPNQAKYQMLLGQAYSYYVNDVSFFSKLGIAHKILAAFQAAVALDPKNPDAVYALAEYYIQAPGIAGGSVDKAKQQIAQLQLLDPVQADLARADLSFDNKDRQAGENYLQAAVKLDKTGESDFQLGMYLLGVNQFPQAIAAFKDGISKDPTNSENYYQGGHAAVLGKTGLQEGIQDLQKYLTMPHGWQPDVPTYKWAHYRLGMLYALAGDKNDARQQYQAALKLDADFKQAKKALSTP